MQNTHATATPENTARATITTAGEVISDSFFAPVEADMIDGLLGRYALTRAKLNEISAILRSGENDQAVSHFLRGNLSNGRGFNVPPVRTLFDLPGAVASLNAEFWQTGARLAR